MKQLSFQWIFYNFEKNQKAHKVIFALYGNWLFSASMKFFSQKCWMHRNVYVIKQPVVGFLTLRPISPLCHVFFFKLRIVFTVWTNMWSVLMKICIDLILSVAVPLDISTEKTDVLCRNHKLMILGSNQLWSNVYNLFEHFTFLESICSNKNRSHVA